MKHKLRPHHAKPVRKRHLGLTLTGVLLLLASFYLFGQGASNVIDRLDPAKHVSDGQNLEIIRSKYGFAAIYDKSELQIDTAVAVTDRGDVLELSGSSFAAESDIISMSFSPHPSSPAHLKTSKLQISSDDSTDIAALLGAGSDDLSDAVAERYKPTSSGSTTYSLASTEDSQIDGIRFTKQTFYVDNQLGGSLGSSRTFAVYWTGISGGRPLVIKLTGLVGGSQVPDIYQELLESISFSNDLSDIANLNAELLGTRGFGTTYADAVLNLDEKYRADLVSPAVVKIYTGVCGELAVNGVAILGSICNGSTGSGFLISSDGYIATNGHVVVYEAEDLIADLLLSDTSFFYEFLTGAGLTQDEIIGVISSPELTAGVVAAVYSVEEDVYSLNNAERRILVALGEKAIDFDDSESFFLEETSSRIKEAKIIAVDYAASDVYTAQYDDGEGFTASDIALLKVDVSNAPLIELADEEPLQNEEVTVIGFPGDAENSLVKQDDIVVSVTSGSVSSVRDAVGSSSRLIQSDVDASAGNSGGPALNNQSEAVGLLTYRYKNDTSTDASKSYIRSIDDLGDLLKSEGLELNTVSTTQDNWLEGIEMFSNNRFSGAIEMFEDIRVEYPAHRLATNYIERAERAIANGQEIKDPNYALIGSIAAAGAMAIIAALVFMARHHKLHRLHLIHHHGSPQF